VEPALHPATGLLVEGNNLSHWRLDPPVLALARPARRPRRMAMIRGRSRHAPVQRLVSLTTIVTLSARVLTTLLALSPRECKKRFSARRAFRSQGKFSRGAALRHAPGRATVPGARTSRAAPSGRRATHSSRARPARAGWTGSTNTPPGCRRRTDSWSAAAARASPRRTALRRQYL